MRTEGRAEYLLGSSENCWKILFKNELKSDGVIEEGQFVISTIVKRGKIDFKIISEWGRYIHIRKFFLTLRQGGFFRTMRANFIGLHTIITSNETTEFSEDME